LVKLINIKFCKTHNSSKIIYILFNNKVYFEIKHPSCLFVTDYQLNIFIKNLKLIFFPE
jgi:hypothetical protein